jgi:glycosyltransferase involved in cell wall biosynthesis
MTTDTQRMASGGSANLHHILLIVSDMGLGGAQRAAATLANGFAAQGHRVKLIETYSAGGECAYHLSPRVQRVQWAVASQRAESKLMSRLKRLFWLRRILRERPDAVVISFLTDVNVATILASLKLPVTTIVTERSYPGMVPLPSWLSWLRRRLYSHAAMVIGQTQVAAEWLSREIASATVRVMPNPFMLPVNSNQPHRPPDLILGQEKRVILAVGRLSAEKGFSVLLEAYAGLSDESRSSASLVILGEGPARQALEQQIHHLNLNEQVFLPGPAGNLSDWYKRADVFVLSSRFEGFPNALLEAQGYGVACVSFDCLAGPADLIDHGRTGLLANLEAGAAGLAAAMANLLSNDEKRKCIGMAAKVASQQFETSQIIAKWENLIAEIKEEKNS